MSVLSDNSPRWSGWLVRPALYVPSITKGRVVELSGIAKPAAAHGYDVKRSVEPISEMFAVESHTGRVETGLSYYPRISVEIYFLVNSLLTVLQVSHRIQKVGVV